MSESQDDFVSTKRGDFWSPAQDEAKQPKVANDNSYIQGVFLDYEEKQGPKENSNIYTFEVHVLEGQKLEKPKVMSFWGSSVLDDMILSKARLQSGMVARIKWLGKKQPKKAGGSPYHDWDVLVPKTQPAPAPAVQSASVKTVENTPVANPNVVNPPADVEEDPDMPF